jgi:DNA-directed RNA polymerase subunit RPC12/RpoP
MGFLQKIVGRLGVGAGATGNAPARHAEMESSQARVACPNCALILDPPPERTRKCPHCGQKIVLLTRLSDDAKLYLNEADARAFDSGPHREAYRNKAIRAASSIGVDEKAFEHNEKELLAKSPGWGPSAVFWALAEEKAKEQLRAGDLHGLSMTCFQQALWAYDEGRPYAHLRARADRYLAEHYASQGFQQLRVDAKDCCSSCAQFDGRTYPIEEAVKEWPVPAEECTRGWCSCTWALPRTLQ